MKRLSVLLITSLWLLVPFGIACGAELDKKGEGSYRAGQSATFKTIPMEKERLEMQFEVTGVVVDAPENSPLHNATMFALGELHAVKGDYAERGFARYTRPDGDAIFMTYEAKGKLGGERKINGTFVGGTGKCAGITGSAEFNGIHGLKPPKEGAIVSMSVGKFSWSIP